MKLVTVAASLLLMLVANGCSRHDGCKAHTGDGLCADPGSAPANSA